MSSGQMQTVYGISLLCFCCCFCLFFNNKSEFWTSLFLGDARKFLCCLLFSLVSKAMLSHFVQDNYGM